MTRRRSGFGSVRKLPSGRYQARYTRPGTERWINGPVTFDTRLDAQAWLATVHADLVRGAWLPPESDITLRTYAETWLAHRQLKDRTREHYRRLLDTHILPTLGDTPLRKLTPALIREWHARVAPGSPTARAHAYALLRTICATAVLDDVIAANPCRIRGAGQSKRASKTEPAALDELATIVAAMPERYRAMVLLAAWCGLRLGELTELRGFDIDTKAGVIHLRRAVVWVGGQPVVTSPKSHAGSRDVAIPPHIVPAVREHLLRHGVGKAGLLFPSGTDPERHMRPTTLHAVWKVARAKAGRPDLRFHDLRHTGLTMAAATGATLKELMARAGHSTASAALRYQHAAKDADARIAARLSELATS